MLAIAALALALVAGCHHAPLLAGRRAPQPQEVPPVLRPAGSLAAAPAVELPPPVEAPRVVGDPGHDQPWNVGLEELLAVALQNSDVVRTLEGSSVSAAGMTSYDPLIAEQRVRQALAIFDPQVAASLYGNWIHAPPSSFYGPGIPEPTRRQEAGFNAALFKPLASGGEARVAYNPPLGYLYLPDDTFTTFNPFHEANVELSLRQPLLRGAGPQVNRAPIVVAQVRADQSVWELKQDVMALVRSVVEAYWDLQAAYVALRSIDELIPLIEEVVRIEEEGFLAQRNVRADVAKARSQLFSFRQQRAAARSAVLDRELRLRNLLGLPPGDGRSLVPVAEPGRAPVAIDGPAAVETALASRPDVIRQRLNVRLREVELVVARNGVRPQLDFATLVRSSGLGEDLGSALKQVGSTKFSDWQTGLTFSMPLGRRAATSNARAATYQLERERALLRQAVHATAHRLGDLVRQIEFTWQQYHEAENRVRETNEWLAGARIRYLNPPPAGEGQDWLLQAVNEYLLTMRTKADAATEASALLARYNALLARWEEAKGTLLETYDVCLEGDPCGKMSIKGRLPNEPIQLDYRALFPMAPQPADAGPPQPESVPRPAADTPPHPAAPWPGGPGPAPPLIHPAPPVQPRPVPLPAPVSPSPVSPPPLRMPTPAVEVLDRHPAALRQPSTSQVPAWR